MTKKQERGRPEGNVNDKRLVIYVSPEVKKKIEKIADTMEMSVSKFMRRKIEAFLAIGRCGKEEK
jgi:predicted transcriptional regulator